MRGFLSLLADTAVRSRWNVLAYCLLSTHYHLLAQTEEPNLGIGMRHIQGRHAQRLNDRTGSAGPIWRDRFHSRPVRDGRHVVRAAVYVDLNPVTAGLCSAPAEWSWSSYRANAGLGEAPAWHRVDCLHARLGAPPDDAAEAYRDVVATTLEVQRARRPGD